jgi:Pvc16 N-terminal domain
MAFELDDRLKDWVGNVIPGAELCLAAPDPKKTGRGVGMYLLELVQSPAPSTTRRPPLQLALRYLITSWSDTPEDAHQMLAALMFAAMENTDFQVELEPIPLSVWTAFDTPPLPSFILRVPMRQERPQPQTKLVREPLKIQMSPIVGFHGVLLGPGEVPLADCRVELPALNLSARTDYQGRFSFPGVPSAGPKQLLVKAKGLELPVSSEQNYPDSRTPLVIHFSLLEE